MDEWEQLLNQIRIASWQVQSVLAEIRWSHPSPPQAMARLAMADSLIADWMEQIAKFQDKLNRQARMNGQAE